LRYASAKKQGQPKRTGPVARAPGSAQPVYKQHASIFRQHAAKSPQQSLAANARAEADIKIAPAVSFKNAFFILSSERLKKFLQRKSEEINQAESIFAKQGRWVAVRYPNEGMASCAGNPIRAAG
jgi:hypothetical protein